MTPEVKKYVDALNQSLTAFDGCEAKDKDTWPKGVQEITSVRMDMVPSVDDFTQTQDIRLSI